MNNQMPYQYGMPNNFNPNMPDYGYRDLELRVDRLEREMKRINDKVNKLEKQHNIGNNPVPYQPYSYNMM